MEFELKKLEKILSRIMEEEELKSPISEETILISEDRTNGIILSSIDYVEFLVDVEKEFDIVYDFDVVFHTIGDLLEYIRKYKEE